MSKKKQSPRNRQKTPSLSIFELEQQVTIALAQDHYKEAIAYYKQLLKQENKTAWQTGLAQAYLERGRELAAKAMYKEAVIMWENRAAACKDESHLGLYMEWLLKAEQYVRAARLYQKHQIVLEKNSTEKQLPALFGALLLSTDNAELYQELKKIPHWETHIQAAQNLLEAYCQGSSDEALEVYLKAIAFRSPFRELRTLIKALSTLETDPLVAQQLLQKIPPDSPYQGLTQLFPRPALDYLDPANSLSKPLPGQERFFTQLYGWNTKQLLAFQQLLNPNKLDGKALFELILKKAPILGTEYVQRLCQQWIPHLAPSYLKQYEQYFPLDDFESARIYALAVEKEDKLFAGDAWDEALELLPMESPLPQTHLIATFIQRRCIQLLKANDEFELSTAEKPLQQCIQWSPEDKTSYLELIALYKQANNKSAYYQQVNDTLKQFPQDVDILLVAVEAAQQRKAFKKAATYAHNILRLDPINIKAREILIESHLGHARKQFKQEKYHLVSKELEAATQYERGKSHIALRIQQAFLAYQLEDQETAHEILSDAIENTESLLVTYALIFIEAEQVNIDPSLFAQVYKRKSKIPPLLPPWSKDYLPTIDELTHLPTLLSHHKNSTALKTFLIEWQSLLKKALQHPLEREHCLSLCEFFKDTHLYELLHLYAKNGFKKYPYEPVFTFYVIYGKTKAKYSAMTSSDHERLDKALTIAKDTDDHRTVMMIIDFVKPRPRFSDNRDSPFEMSGQVLDIEELLKNDPDKVLRMAFDGRMPSEEELDELGPDGLMMRILQKMTGRNFDGADNDHGSKLPFPDFEEEDDDGGKEPVNKPKKRKRRK